MCKVCFALVMSVFYVFFCIPLRTNLLYSSLGAGGGSNLCLVLTLRANLDFVSDGVLSMHKCALVAGSPHTNPSHTF